MKSSTEVVTEYLLAEDGMPEVVREWNEDSNRRRRERQFARTLREDLTADLTFVVDPRFPGDVPLQNQLMSIVLGRVDWTTVARTVLRRAGKSQSR